MPKQIGWSNESNLLYTISSQISRLAGIIATSGGGGGGTITGGGASGQVTFWNGATSITGSNNLFWDAAQNRLGIGTNTPQTSGELATSGARLRFNQTVGGSIFHGIEFATNGTVYSSLLANQNTGEVRLSTNASYFPTFYASGSEGMRLTTNRNLIIQNGGTFTDDGVNRLQVGGDVKITSSGTSSSSNALRVLNSSSSVLLNARSDGEISIGAGGWLTIGNSQRYIYKGINQTTILTIANDSDTSCVIDFYGSNHATKPRTISLVSTFAPTSGSIGFAGFEILNIINQTGGANGITRGLLVNPTFTVAPFNWRSIEWSNNTGWGLYGAGTAPNYLGGDLAVAGVLRETVTTNRQTASYTLVLADRGKLVETNVGAANTITVPPNSSITFPIGTKIDIAQYGAGQTTIVPGIGVTVRSAGGALKLSAQYSGATIVKIGTDEWYLFGDITV